MRKILYILTALILMVGFVSLPAAPIEAGVPPFKLQLIKYNDLNNNGIDDTEPRLAGWRFLVEGPIDENTNSIEVTTDSSGEFILFLNPTITSFPPPAVTFDYDITEFPRDDCVNTDPPDGTMKKTVTFILAENTDDDVTEQSVSFGNYCPGNGDENGNHENGTVGGTVGHIDRFNVLAPWLGLGLIIIGGIGWLAIRRLRIQN